MGLKAKRFKPIECIHKHSARSWSRDIMIVIVHHQA
jgi:hypothetical protein